MKFEIEPSAPPSEGWISTINDEDWQYITGHPSLSNALTEVIDYCEKKGITVKTWASIKIEMIQKAYDNFLETAATANQLDILPLIHDFLVTLGLFLKEAEKVANE